MNARPETALRRLHEMRRHRRSLRAWTGLARWLVLVGVLVWLSFLLDYFLVSTSIHIGIYFNLFFFIFFDDFYFLFSLRCT